MGSLQGSELTVTVADGKVTVNEGITAEELLARDDLADILKYHVIPGAKVMSTDLKAGEQKVGSLQGSELTVTVAGGKVTVNKTSLQKSFLHAVIWQTS